MGCVDVNGTVHMVRLRCICVCNIGHEWVPHHSVQFYTYIQIAVAVEQFHKIACKKRSRIQKESHRANEALNRTPSKCDVAFIQCECVPMENSVSKFNTDCSNFWTRMSIETPIPTLRNPSLLLHIWVPHSVDKPMWRIQDVRKGESTKANSLAKFFVESAWQWKKLNWERYESVAHPGSAKLTERKTSSRKTN